MPLDFKIRKHNFHLEQLFTFNNFHLHQLFTFNNFYLQQLFTFNNFSLLTTFTFNNFSPLATFTYNNVHLYQLPLFTFGENGRQQFLAAVNLFLRGNNDGNYHLSSINFEGWGIHWNSAIILNRITELMVTDNLWFLLVFISLWTRPNQLSKKC